MLRRAGPPALLLALGLASGVLVARLPPDLETTVVTRRHHGADPLLSAVLLRFGVDSLLHHPSRYFQPPILFPDPNPLRGTEPLVAEALLAVPFRLALGDRPAAVYTSVKIVTLALLTLGTGLMLKELGVGLGLCLLGGGLSVLVSTTVGLRGPPPGRVPAVAAALGLLRRPLLARRASGPGGGLRRVPVPDRPGEPVHDRHAARRGPVSRAAPPGPAGRGGGPAPRDGTGARRRGRRRALPAHPEAVRRGPRGRGRLLDGGVRLREDLERGRAHGPAHEPARVRPARVAAGAGLLLGRRLPGHRVRAPRGWPGRARAHRRGEGSKAPARRRAPLPRASRLGTPARAAPRRADGRSDPLGPHRSG